MKLVYVLVPFGFGLWAALYGGLPGLVLFVLCAGLALTNLNDEL